MKHLRYALSRDCLHMLITAALGLPSVGACLIVTGVLLMLLAEMCK